MPHLRPRLDHPGERDLAGLGRICGTMNIATGSGRGSGRVMLTTGLSGERLKRSPFTLLRRRRASRSSNCRSCAVSKDSVLRGDHQRHLLDDRKTGRIESEGQDGVMQEWTAQGSRGLISSL